MARAIEILLYVPNLIGYARVILLFMCYFVMIKNYLLAILFYSVSSLLDAFDGYYARKLNQSSKFGGLLDMLTDRAATTCLIMCLCYFYPEWIFALQLWVFLDITSHWAHQLASVFRGEQSHKSTAKDTKRNIILRLYYTSRPFLFFMCAMNETYFSCLYLLHFTEGWTIPFINIGIWRTLLWSSFPFMCIKTIISFIHLLDAAWSLACIESESSLENPLKQKKEEDGKLKTSDSE
jgi:CDP-diacylglycerol--inositol 3-phosphatidyltransferase